MSAHENRRILLVDDMPDIHQDFRKILMDDSHATAFDEVEAELFGKKEKRGAFGNAPVHFELDSAFQGQEALDKVCAAVQEKRPYAMAFVDMRMQPGWDSVETIKQLWEKDPLLQIVICTAYSDYSWEEVLSRLEIRDRLLVLKKPFDVIEVYQLANSLTTKWEMARQAALHMHHLEERVIERTEALQKANLELKGTLQTLKMAQEELIRSERLAALGSLVAAIAHELNTPIGNSLMVASTLADHTREFNKSYHQGLKRQMLESYLSDIDTAGDILMRNLHHAANLIASFKQVAVDQTSAQRRKFSLSQMISEIMLTLEPILKKTSYKVEQNIPEGLLFDSYPGPLGQVVTNLINNTLLHGFEGREAGTISLTAQEADEGWMEFTVKDNGVGIPAANLPRIFDPFFTTKLGAGGTGLGLNIVHNIVTDILLGNIRVESEVGIGTTFVLTLPLIAPHKQSEESATHTNELQH